jgi:hypothetical protein
VADRPFGDRIVGGEVFDRPVGTEVDEEGVDLDEFARGLRFSALGQALGVAMACGQAEASAAAAPSQDWRGNDNAPLHQAPGYGRIRRAADRSWAAADKAADAGGRDRRPVEHIHVAGEDCPRIVKSVDASKRSARIEIIVSETERVDGLGARFDQPARGYRAFLLKRRC